MVEEYIGLKPGVTLADYPDTTCDHDWIVVESFDLPAQEGYKRNVSKIYCTECDKMKEVKYE